MSEEKVCRICGAKHGTFNTNPLTHEKTCIECSKRGVEDSHQMEIRRLSQIISSLRTQNEELREENELYKEAKERLEQSNEHWRKKYMEAQKLIKEG